ncbi:hypothetical protein F4167_18350 [Candidatus Poribacteria bacterium]|nr:hypothetical protein [Candidatus Poribacteria bacterium]MYG08533.1 hypothetical protein [Candidatus Poribacteria bacterium]MYK17806.1 hypothetical protein [Candidatus Poribacteria bacterium]
MDKKIVGITLILTALFVVGGVVLETHGGGSITGDFSMMEGYWTLSASASAGASGACASASPYIPGWEDLTGNVDENGHGNMDAMPKIYHCSGSASVEAKRDGYWTWPTLSPIPWWHKAKNQSDSATIEHKVRVHWGEHEFDETTYQAGIDLSQFNIPANASVSYTPGGPAKYHWWVSVPESYKSLSASVGGQEYVNKSSGACGSFEGWSFTTSDSYEGEG